MVPRRRNGLREACEPCRRRKLACDHTYPTCMRCQKGKKRMGTQCVYRSAHIPRDASLTTDATLSSHDLSDNYGVPDSDRCSETAYLGSTSIASFVGDAQIHLDISGSSHLLCADGSARTITSSVPDLSNPLNDYQHSLALTIIRCLPHGDTAEMLLKKSFSPVDEWMQPAIEHLMKSVWNTFELDPSTRHYSKSVKSMIQVICANAKTCLQETEDTLRSWYQSYSGRNIRWESLGIIFVTLAVGILRHSSRERTRRQGHIDDRSSRTGQSPPVSSYISCVESCLELCGRTRRPNLVLLYLLFKFTHLTSVYYGDASM
jgi:hypothetical protein